MFLSIRAPKKSIRFTRRTADFNRETPVSVGGKPLNESSLCSAFGTESREKRLLTVSHLDSTMRGKDYMAKKNTAAQTLGRKGGQATAQKRTKEERAAFSRNAANARWSGSTLEERQRATAPARKARKK